MDLSRPVDPSKLLTLQETASLLAVSIDVLLRWNEHQILKPTITQTGQIGYTQAQIDQFLKIQQSLRAATTPHAPNVPSVFPGFSSQENNKPQMSYSQALDKPQQEVKGTSPSFRLVSSVAIVLALLTIAVLTQQGQFNSLLNQYEKNAGKSDVLSAETSNSQITLPAASGQSMQLNKNPQDESQSALSAKSSNQFFANKQETKPSTPTYSSPTASVAGAIKSQLAQKAQGSSRIPNETADSETTTFANTAKQQTDPVSPNSLFDKSGNITGQISQADVLAMSTGASGLMSGVQPSNPVSSQPRNQLILIILAASGTVYFLMKKPKKTFDSVQEIKPSQPSQKFLEIDQRMDGTIVLTFQGKDYKVSKPELHSDSDRFFERLMEVVGDTAKEIEYDNYSDADMRLSTPLSRLVTRLGFVGIKRDLFFPRTSKHNVLFRKYITREDLNRMNLTPEQITKDLLQTFSNQI